MIKMSVTSLYKMNQEFQEFMTYFCELDEEEYEQSIDDINDIIEKLSGDIKEKALNTAACYKNMMAEVEAMKQYEKAMADKRKSLQGKAERLLNSLSNNLQAAGIDKVSNLESTITIKESKKVKVTDIDLLDEKYIRKVVKHEDGVLLRKELLSGAEISGAELDITNVIKVK